MNSKQLTSITSTLASVTNDIDGVHDYLDNLYQKQGGSLNQIGAKGLSRDTDKLSHVQQFLQSQTKN